MDNTDLVTKKLDQLERRKKRNWMARYSITLVIVFTFILLIGLLFFEVVPTDARDLLNILLGAYVAVLAKATDYWFKEKEDPEIAEMQEFDKRNGNGNGNVSLRELKKYLDGNMTYYARRYYGRTQTAQIVVNGRELSPTN